jgi:hypothetical protein
MEKRHSEVGIVPDNQLLDDWLHGQGQGTQRSKSTLPSLKSWGGYWPTRDVRGMPPSRKDWP